jgi:hypothetical protein
MVRGQSPVYRVGSDPGVPVVLVFPAPIPSQLSASNKNRSLTIYVTIDPDDATLESAAKDRSA